RARPAAEVALMRRADRRRRAETRCGSKDVERRNQPVNLCRVARIRAVDAQAVRNGRIDPAEVVVPLVLACELPSRTVREGPVADRLKILRRGACEEPSPEIGR